MDDFDIYASGLCCMSVCTTLTDIAEIERLANEEAPTGLEWGWTISRDRTFKGGELIPAPCERHPETHRHYLLNC